MNVSAFPWGRVLAVHEIGRYSIVEYAERVVKGVTVTNEESGQSAFHPYVDGKDTHHSYGTLEEALVGAIAYAREGINHRADRYFFKMTEQERAA